MIIVNYARAGSNPSPLDPCPKLDDSVSPLNRLPVLAPKDR